MRRGEDNGSIEYYTEAAMIKVITDENLVAKVKKIY